MTLEIRLSQRARRDIQAITDYTFETWGKEQAARYIGGLTEVFQNIGETPGIGRPRPTIGEGMRSLRYRSHLIFYQPQTTFITIAAVLHQSQDIQKNLGQKR